MEVVEEEEEEASSSSASLRETQEKGESGKDRLISSVYFSNLKEGRGESETERPHAPRSCAWQFDMRRLNPAACSAFLVALLVVGGIVAASLHQSRGGRSAPKEIQGDESIMAEKQHGTCVAAPQDDLRWNADWETADRIS